MEDDVHIAVRRVFTDAAQIDWWIAWHASSADRRRIMEDVVLKSANLRPMEATSAEQKIVKRTSRRQGRVASKTAA